MAGLYVNIPGTLQGSDDLDEIEQKVGTLAIKADALFPTFSGDDELTTKAVEQLSRFNKTITEILSGIALALKGDADRTSITAKLHNNADVENQESVSDITTRPKVF